MAKLLKDVRIECVVCESPDSWLLVFLISSLKLFYNQMTDSEKSKLLSYERFPKGKFNALRYKYSKVSAHNSDPLESDAY